MAVLPLCSRGKPKEGNMTDEAYEATLNARAREDCRRIYAMSAAWGDKAVRADKAHHELLRYIDVEL